MKKRGKINNNHILYLSCLSSDLLYSYYKATHFFALRIFASLTLFVFYFLVVKYLSQNKSELIKRSRHTPYKAVYVYLGITLFLLLFSFGPNVKDLYTLFFHPFAFPGFFVAVLVLTVGNSAFADFYNVSKKINTFLPVISVADYVLFGDLYFLHTGIYFLLFEYLFLDKLKMKRGIFLTVLLLAAVYYENRVANRGLAMMLAGSAFLLGVFYFMKFLRNKQIIYIALGVLFVICYFLAFHFTETFNFIQSTISSDQIDSTDTRSFLYAEFFNGFKGFDWLAGRGYLGTYFSDYFYDRVGIDEQGDYFIRFTIEIGFMEFLLKGGLLILVPYILLLARTLQIGLTKYPFQSIAFRLSIFLLVHFFLLTFSSPPGFNTHHIVVWLIIGIILNETVRGKIIASPIKKRRPIVYPKNTSLKR